MQEPPIITWRQGVSVMKKRLIKEYFINVSASDHSAERDDEQSCDGMFHNLFALYRCFSKRQIWRRQLFAQLFFLGRSRWTVRTITLVKLGPEMGVVLNLFAQLVKLE